MVTAQVKKQKKPATINPYLVQKVMSASPEQLISYVYDAGIAACAQKDRDKGLKVIRVLIKALNFDHKEVAIPFYNVYRFLNYSLSCGNFAVAKEYFETLKSTWAKSMKVV